MCATDVVKYGEAELLANTHAVDMILHVLPDMHTGGCQLREVGQNSISWLSTAGLCSSWLKKRKPGNQAGWS
jgi:hypothetical protein